MLSTDPHRSPKTEFLFLYGGKELEICNLGAVAHRRGCIPNICLEYMVCDDNSSSYETLTVIVHSLEYSSLPSYATAA